MCYYNLILPLAMLHHGNVMYVKKALRGTDCALFVSFQKWKVWVNPRIVQSGLYAPSSNSERKRTLLVIHIKRYIVIHLWYPVMIVQLTG